MYRGRDDGRSMGEGGTADVTRPWDVDMTGGGMLGCDEGDLRGWLGTNGAVRGEKRGERGR